ncbi:hypothetical protein C0992_004732 [Termitomyces sp. T32_za158]|nr:hypothetical protein C0992_004732 [Termitomyces sp. T32_za158]
MEYPPTPASAPAALSPTMAAGIGLAAQVGTAAAGPHLPLPEEWTTPHVSPALIRFKNSWEVFVDSLIREWKTLNVVSALLLSAILTMFQIQSAADDPITRTAAFLSLIYLGPCEEARKTKTVIWWNVWVLLAMPAIWMSWVMVLFIASILSFVWRTGSVSDPDDRPALSERGALGARLAVTGVFMLGMIYFVLIVRTLKSYGMQANNDTSRQREPVAVEHAPHPGARDGDDVTADRRGRERQRGVSGPRKREDTPEMEQKYQTEPCKERKEKGGLRSILGLGIMGIGARENGRVVQVDFEKGDDFV